MNPNSPEENSFEWENTEWGNVPWNDDESTPLSLRQRVAGEILYDDVFTLEQNTISPRTLETGSYPRTFYLVMPRNQVFYRWVLELVGQVEELTQESLAPKSPAPSSPSLDAMDTDLDLLGLGFGEVVGAWNLPVTNVPVTAQVGEFLREEQARCQKLSEQIEAHLDTLIVTFVVAWDLSPTQNQLRVCTLGGMRRLDMATKRSIVEMFVERIRLWKMLH